MADTAPVGVRDAEDRRASALEHARIADLAARLGIERRALEHHDALLARRQRLDALTTAQQRDDGARRRERVVAAELAAHFDLRTTTQVDAEAAGRAGALALRLHLGLVAGHVHLQAAFARDVGGEVRREAVGVVQQEYQRAGHRIAAGLPHARLELAHAAAQRLGKAALFGLERLLDIGAALEKLGVSHAHRLRQHWHQRVEEQPIAAESVTVAAGTADDAPEHVAAPFVGGQHAIGYQEARGADVIGDHPQ